MARIAINITTGSLQQEDVIVGIDLGTTNSLVAFMHPETGHPVAIRDRNHSALLPSVIYFDESGAIVAGDEAKQQLLLHPERTIYSAKRLMGKSSADLGSHADFFAYHIPHDPADTLVKVKVGDDYYSPVELSAIILKELKARAEHYLKTAVTRAVITVPAYFNDSQRQATRDAGRLAGLDVLRILNEPTAASLAYGLGLDEKSRNDLIAVYDLGGGTFDISILRITDGIYEVLSTNGDTFLGGDDMDKAIAEFWISEYGMDGKRIYSDKSLMQSLRILAEQAKRHLTGHDRFEAGFQSVTLHLDRTTLERLIDPILEKSLDCCKKALSDAGLTAGEIKNVVMVGGSTRVPYVKKRVSSFFGREVLDSVDPDEAVALGAAIQANILAGRSRDQLLLDVTPLSLGIETSGGLMDVLIPRNSRIPVRVSRQYTTQADGQSGMRISVYQGERDLVRDNRKLAEFNLTGIPGMPAGLPKVEVSFMINADGILMVAARELRSGVETLIEVRPQYGLTEEEVERMLSESIRFAGEDMTLRALTEARTEAESLLKTTERFLQKNSTSLTPEELLATAGAMQSLQLAITMDDKDLIQRKIEELNEISRPYAERVMNDAVSKALSGKRI